MYYIILRTPPDIYNSEYTAHLIEHLELAVQADISEYFNIQQYDGTSYSYYSTYTIDTTDREKVNIFIEKLILPIQSTYLTREKKRIREELADPDYSKKIVEAVGKIWYGETYRYARPTRSSLTEIQSYHSQYYTRENISVYTKSNIITTDIYDPGLNTISRGEFRVGHNRNICLYTDLSSISICVFFLLEKLFDSYLDYLDVLSGKYWARYTVQWEHPEKVWISYKTSDRDDLASIPDDFIRTFVIDTLENSEKDSENNIPEHDLVSLLHFWSALSKTVKTTIIWNIDSYYQQIRTHMLSK